MSENYDFPGKAEELLKDAIREFASWAVRHWTMTEAEAETLTDGSPCPGEYSRGYNAAIEGLMDAVDCWMDEHHP